MDFFEDQYKAKRNSKFLYGMFFLVILLFQFSIALAVGIFTDAKSILGMLTHPWSIVGGLIGTIIYLIGCFIEWRRLSGGGKAIAKRLHAKPLYRIKVQDALNEHDTQIKETFSKDEERLLEVVNHMSLASGVSAPHVFVLPNEQGINAFVAGTKAHDTVLVVTEGAINQLSNNELYALVGHEFSHIAHGDTKQNMILLVLMGGFMAFFTIGSEIIDHTSDDDYLYDSYTDSYSLHRNQKSQEDPTADILIFLVGALIMSFSFIGIVFARLFKYAFLRQREYLADASSVQYTRSFDLVSVLDKVRNTPTHGCINQQNIETFSHFFFANAIPSSQLSSVLSTHPPIDRRIKAISESHYDLLKVQNEAKERRQARLNPKDDAQLKREQIEQARMENHFQYREKSDYDGTPVEFSAQNNNITNQQNISQPNTHNTSTNSVQPSPQTSLNSNNTATPNINPEDVKVVPALQKITENKSLKIQEKNADLIDPLIDVLNTPKGCLEMIAAVLACHQQTDISPLDYEISVTLYDLLQNKTRESDIDTLLHALDMLAQKTFKIDSHAAKLYMNRLYHICQIDGRQTMLEQLILDRIAFQLGLVPNIDKKNTTPEHKIAFAFTMLANAFLEHDNHPQTSRELILKRMRPLINIQSSAWQKMETKKISVSECINQLFNTPNALQNNILNTLETTMLADGHLCSDEQYMLKLLKWRTHILTKR